MRADAFDFAALNEAPSKRPRFIAAIIYPVDSLYITSHEGIENVPGTVIEGALLEPTVTSQRLKPDEASAEIGAASFALVDLGEMFTSEVRERLADGNGLRGRQVRFYLGYDGLSFGQFQLVGTQIVQNASYKDGRYQVQCLDIQRALRSQIFTLVQTTLAASIDDTQTTITLTSADGLQRVAHGTSYSDAPSQTVGYIKIKGEIIRYADIVGNQVTGCTRGVFGTSPSAYDVDPGTPADRREKVTEYVYLELPAIKLAWAILTGQIWGTSDVLPEGWHLGIDPALITEEDFTGIGSDLWDTADDERGFVVRFEGLSKQDGKRFLEKEIYLLTGTYSPVYADGTLGLRRMTRLSEGAATVATLDESNSVQIGDLRHDMESLHNVFVVNWSWNGQEFRRATAYVDTASKAVHGAAPTYTLNFKGLYGARHTDGVVFSMLDLVRDRYAGPPLRTTVQLLHAMNRIEVGDVVRLRYRHVRDFSQKDAIGPTSLDRAFEVQNVTVDHRVGRVSVELFGSSADPSISAPTAAASSLPNAFYTSEGTALAAAPGMTVVGGVLTGATQVLSGGNDLNAAPSIYYHDGDLTIAAGVTLSIAANVQLRVRGFLTVNGTIEGVGRGHAGVADDGRLLLTSTSEGNAAAEWIPGNAGYVGSSRGYDGVMSVSGVLSLRVYATMPMGVTASKHSVAPRLLLSVEGNALRGLPTDLRGTGGGPGGRVGRSTTVPYPAGQYGGTGAPGGAGLAIVCRGMAAGANGLIDLSGTSSTPTDAYTTDVDRYPGAGGAGGPGTLYVLLDGGSLSVPDFGGGKYRARTGAVPVLGNPLPRKYPNQFDTNPAATPGSDPGMIEPLAGFTDNNFVTNNAQDLSGSALVIQHIPAPESAFPDEVSPVLAPTGLTTESAEQSILVYLALPDFSEFDSVQVWASKDDQRANATKVAEGKFDFVRHRVSDGTTFNYWARTKLSGNYSAWYPVSPTDGISGQSLGGLIARGFAEVFGTSARKTGGVPAWDSDMYSAETYSGGCFISFQPSAAAIDLAVGLNSDPESDQHYTSLDYQWRLSSDGNAYIYEGTAQRANAGTYTPNTVLSIKYDGALLQYFKDGALVRNLVVIDAALFVDSAFYTPNAGIENIKYGPLSQVPSIPWIARGNCVATATTARKNGGAGAWDSDIYSFEAYRNGAFVSFQADQVDGSAMVGLNADPTADQSYASIDFAWYIAADGTARIYESGGSVLTAGSYTINSVLAIAYDGKTVRYLLNGALVREVYAPDRTFYMDASFSAPGTSIRNLTFTPFGTTTPVPFLSRGNVVVSDTTAQKIGGAAAFDSDFISINGYSQAFIEFKPSQVNARLMVGLNADPYASQSYQSIDAAWYPSDDGNIYIYESGSQIANLGAYTPATILGITYDGSNVRYYKDNILQRTLALSVPRMFADASFYTPGAAINSLRFGPGSTLTQLDTAQIGQNAATSQIQSIAADGSFSFPDINTGTPFQDIRTVTSIAISNPTGTAINIEISYKGIFYLGGFETSGIGRYVWLAVSGSASYSESSVGGRFSTHQSSDPFTRSGSVALTVPPGGSITASVRIALTAQAGAYSGISNAHWRDLVLTGTAIKR